MSSDPEELARMRSWLWTVLVGQGLALEECGKLLLAVGELCNNSIKHAYEGRGGQPIQISLTAAPDQLVIEVEDWGRPFDASSYRQPDLDSTPDHGLGLFLVQSVVDQLLVDVKRASGTRWTLIRRRPTPE